MLLAFQVTLFFTLTPSGNHTPGGVELACYYQAMAQLGRVSLEQIFVGIGRGSNLGPLAPQFRSVSTTIQGLPHWLQMYDIWQRGKEETSWPVIDSINNERS